eukprot:403366759
MYLPSLNELNKTAVQQKVIDQSDERIQRNAHQSKSVLGANKNTSDQNTSKFSINHQEDSVLTPLTNKQNNSLTSAGGLSNNQASGQGGFQAQNQNQLQQGPRRDRYGNVIRIGEKAHKLSFRDQVEKGEKISQIYEVESWKQYNTPTDMDDSAFSCKCVIF